MYIAHVFFHYHICRNSMPIFSSLKSSDHSSEFHFRGARVIGRVIDDLLRTGMKQATHVLVTGTRLDFMSFSECLYLFTGDWWKLLIRYTVIPRFTVSLYITCLFVFPRYRVLQWNMC